MGVIESHIEGTVKKIKGFLEEGKQVIHYCDKNSVELIKKALKEERYFPSLIGFCGANNRSLKDYCALMIDGGQNA